MSRLVRLPSRESYPLSSIELCAGGGGQAIGLEQAGFHHTALLELDRHACATLRRNRPDWNVVQADIKSFDFKAFADANIDLLAGGLPCPPFSRAGKQLGEDDERNLWPSALRAIHELKPRAILLENVRGILDAAFDDFRDRFQQEVAVDGYTSEWRLIHAADYGVPQLRPRTIFVAVKATGTSGWRWPNPHPSNRPTVGDTLFDLMNERGWRGAIRWRQQANRIAPTIVGGSHKHGGPDLGPTRARKEWSALGVDGLGIANSAPDRDFVGVPRLTVRMVARLQGFPDAWEFCGGKTAAYRQVGNAFPPPVAFALGRQLAKSLRGQSFDESEERAG